MSGRTAQALAGLLLLQVLAWAPGQAQSQPTGASVPQVGNWLIYFGNQNFADNKFVWHNEVQYRNYNAIGQTEQLLLRTGVGHYLSENNNLLSVGYAYIFTNPLAFKPEGDFLADDLSFDEHRIWQQFITRQAHGRFYLLHRYRYEQRFFGERDFRTRFRYFLSLNVALSKPKIEARTFYLSAYNEVFVNGERADTRALFDRNRLYGALGYQISPATRVEVGLMRQSLASLQGSRTQFQVVFFNNLPFPQRRRLP